MPRILNRQRNGQMHGRTAAAVSVLLVCGVLAACKSTEQPGSAPAPTSTAATALNSVEEGQRQAVKALQDWLAHPGQGTMSFDGIEFSSVKGGDRVARDLTGPIDVASGTCTLTGTRTVFSSAAPDEAPMYAIEHDKQIFTSIPPDDLPQYGGHKWFVNNLTDAAMPTGTGHSVWREALDSVSSVHLDGPSTVGGESAVEYSGEVDAATLPGAAQLVTESSVFQKAGSTEIGVDIYTDLGTGKLLEVAYRLGLQASVDATPTAKSLAGYEVDLVVGGPQPSPSPTQSAPPEPREVTSGGNTDDLWQLMFF